VIILSRNGRAVRSLIAFGALALMSRLALAQAPEIDPPRQLTNEPVPYPPGGSGEAEVLLELTIGRDGTVTAARPLRGKSPFRERALIYAKNWKFEPARKNGVPVASRIQWQVLFEPPAPVEVPAEPVAPGEPPPTQVRIERSAPPEIAGIALPAYEARQVPGAQSDPLKAIDVLPGVAPVLSGLPHVFVRSAPPSSVGYFIDGIRVPLLYHIGTGPSVLAAGLIDHVDLFASGYPASIGLYSGGIVSGTTRDPSVLPTGEIAIKAYEAAGLIEQPFLDGKGHLLLAGRYGYPRPLLSVTSPDYNLAYHDYQARLSFDLGISDRLSILAFGAADRVENKELPAPLFDTGFQRAELRWEHDHETGGFRLSAVAGREQIGTLTESFSTDAPSGAVAERDMFLALFQIQERIFEGLEFRAGLEGELAPVRRELDIRPNAYNVFEKRTDRRGTAYADLRIVPVPSFEFKPGIRVDQLRSRGTTETYVEPRGALRVVLGRGVAWLSSAGLAHQVPSLATQIPGTVASDNELVNRTSRQGATGFEFLMPADLMLHVTGFAAWVNTPVGDPRSYGIELMLHRDFTRQVGGLLGYTLSQSKLGKEAAPFDRRHVVTGAVSVKLPLEVRFGLRGYYASGRPYVFQCDQVRCPGVLPVSESGRFPGFFRLDAELEKRWQFSEGRWLQLSASWFNASLQSEYDQVQWIPAQQALALTTRGPLTLPSLTLAAGY
jgi:hypothetical protein